MKILFCIQTHQEQLIVYNYLLHFHLINTLYVLIHYIPTQNLNTELRRTRRIQLCIDREKIQYFFFTRDFYNKIHGDINRYGIYIYMPLKTFSVDINILLSFLLHNDGVA